MLLEAESGGGRVRRSVNSCGIQGGLACRSQGDQPPSGCAPGVFGKDSERAQDWEGSWGTAGPQAQVCKPPSALTAPLGDSGDTPTCCRILCRWGRLNSKTGMLGTSHQSPK